MIRKIVLRPASGSIYFKPCFLSRRCSFMIQLRPSLCQALGLIPSTAKQNRSCFSYFFCFHSPHAFSVRAFSALVKQVHFMTLRVALDLCAKERSQHHSGRYIPGNLIYTRTTSNILTMYIWSEHKLQQDKNKPKSTYPSSISFYPDPQNNHHSTPGDCGVSKKGVKKNRCHCKCKLKYLTFETLQKHRTM